VEIGSQLNMRPYDWNAAKPFLIPFIGAGLLAVSSAIAWGVPSSIVLDGSLGTSGPLTGPNYIIPASVGKQMGPNLFQSFSQFNLTSSESATFTGTGSVGAIDNIIARVTGGSASSIDGTINSTIPGANLFLLNPAGVMFGANAKVNISGSFVAGTPDYVKFTDGYKFSTSLGGNDNLTSAPVSAFGFLSSTPSAITATGSQITMQNGTGLHLIGGDVTLNDATLLAPAGAMTIFSAASSGEVPFSLASPGSGFSTATVTKYGSISLTNQAQFAIDGAGGGSVVIRGGKLTVNNSFITSGNSGLVTGGNISVQADQLTINNGGFIATESFANAMAGGINVNVAGNLDIDGSGSQISTDTGQSTLAPGGPVTVNAGGAIDLNSGEIAANTNSSGNAGTVTVTGQSMSMEGVSRVSSISAGVGNAGTVNLTLNGPLTMSDTAGIVADTYGPGKGGDVVVQAGQVAMSGQTLISANTLSSGNGGNINLQTGSLSIQGTGTEPPNSLGIVAQAFSSGDAGTINVTAGNLSLDGGAVISSSSFGAGNGGSVLVNSAQAELFNESLISASAEFSNGGSVQIDAGDSLQMFNGSSVSTSAGKNGGDITLEIGQLFYLYNSNVQAFAGVSSVPGQQVGGRGGNILIDPEFVVLGNSFISANDLSGLGEDGNIVNTATFFFSSDSLLHATGTIQTTAPDLELANSLLGLPANLIDVQNRLRESCAQSVNHEFSTFIVVGRDGTETGPNELQPDFGLILP
jgi:filamentous hemagglutinin family protein